MERYRGGLLRTNKAWVVEFPQNSREGWDIVGRLEDEPSQYIPVEAFNTIMRWDNPDNAVRYVRLEHMVGKFQGMTHGEYIWESYGVYDMDFGPGQWVDNGTRAHLLLHWQGSTACGSVLLPGWKKIQFDGVNGQGCEDCVRYYDKLVRHL